jgi:glyoxylase-like metal-dependent hydrolase (beta-lactamase superfamily II)
MARSFASTADSAEKKTSFTELAPGAFAYTAEGDPNAGVVFGPDGILIIDALATPVLAQSLLREIRKRSDLPISVMVMSHYHAVRALGAAAFRPAAIVASRGTAELIEERGMADFRSEVGRFPRLFHGVETVPGLTRPTVVFERELTLHLGKREVRVLHLGRGHTRGDTVVWLPKEKLLYAGDLVEKDVAVYCGDAYLKDWPRTLDRLEALGARILVPGRGASLIGAKAVNAAIASTRGFVTDMYRQVSINMQRRASLKEAFDAAAPFMRKKYGAWPIFEHCIPFNVTRAYQEAKGVEHPEIWTAARDRAMWKALQG